MAVVSIAAVDIDSKVIANHQVGAFTVDKQAIMRIKPVIIRVVIKVSVGKKAYSCFIDTFATFKVFL